MECQLNGNGGGAIKKKILFGPPPKDVVVKIGNTNEDLVVESVEVIESGDFVLVKGYFNKTIEYFTTNRDALNEDTENEEKENKNFEDEDDEEKHKKEVMCDLISPELQAIAIDGVIRHTTVWIPFEILIKVEGAKVGDKAIVDCIDIEPLFKENRIQEIKEEDSIIGVLINEFISVNVSVEDVN